MRDFVMLHGWPFVAALVVLTVALVFLEWLFAKPTIEDAAQRRLTKRLAEQARARLKKVA